jgi:hypothetical protein
LRPEDGSNLGFFLNASSASCFSILFFYRNILFGNSYKHRLKFFVETVVVQANETFLVLASYVDILEGSWGFGTGIYFFEWGLNILSCYALIAYGTLNYFKLIFYILFSKGLFFTLLSLVIQLNSAVCSVTWWSIIRS